MKKKSFLIFLLAVASAATVAVAGCDKKKDPTPDAGGHTQHVYTWKYDDVNHWQQCECGDKKNEKPHVDVLNNDSKQDGADDKCDVCGLEKHTVSFNLQNHGAAIEAQKIYKGGKATKPADPQADEWLFGGWFTSPGCTVEYDFNSAVKADMTIYAKWTENAKPVVTFDANGHGTAPASVKASADGKVTKPDDLSEEDWVFGGWYKESECTNAFDFATDTVSANTTLYAKWTEDTRPKVTFDVQGHGTAPAAVRVEAGGAVAQPAAPANTADWKFAGWYKESECTNEFDFATETISADTTVYAKWVPNTNPLVTFDANGHGTAPAAVRSDDNGKVTKPDDLSEDGWIFGGWYKESACTNAFDFTTEAVTTDTTLYAKWTEDTRPVVTFDANGHGTAPASVRVEVGGLVEKPDDLSEDEWKFGGWYKESACTNAFDFDTETISVNTILYAKWTATVQTLTVDNGDLYSFGDEQQLKFKFTSSKTGRYRLAPRNKNTQDCTYTTNLDAMVHTGEGGMLFDLNAHGTLTITLTRDINLSDTAKVGFTLTEVVDEDLPEGSWASGTYYNANYSLVLNRDTKQVTYNDKIMTFTYVGGSINTATFVEQVTSTKTNTCQLKYAGKNQFTFIINNKTAGVLELDVPQPPKTLAEISGVYEYNDGESSSVLTNFGGYTKISIYESGNGYMVDASDKNAKKVQYVLGSAGCRFEADKNKLYYGNYQISLTLDDNENVVALKVVNTDRTAGNAAYNKSLVFNRIGAAEKEIPEKLPISSGLDLVGEHSQYAISSVYGTAKWADGTAITITDYNKVSGKDVYTVNKSGVNYALEIEGTGDNTVIKVYNASQTALLDTLTKKTAKANPLVTDGSKMEFKPSDTFGSWKSVFFTIPVNGTYTFTGSDRYMQLYTNVSEYNVTGIDGKSFSASFSIALKADTVIAVSIAENPSLSQYWITATVVEDTGGGGDDDKHGSGTQSDPYVFTQAGKVDIDGFASGTKLYIKFTATEAGTYELKARNLTNGSGAMTGQPAEYITVNVDNVTYGYYNFGWYYEGEKLNNDDQSTAYNKYTAKGGIKITVEVGQEVTIVLTQQRMSVLTSLFEIIKQD